MKTFTKHYLIFYLIKKKELNVLSRVNQINELTTFVENLVCEHFRSWDENSPFRNMFLRHLVERVFETLSNNKVSFLFQFSSIT